ELSNRRAVRTVSCPRRCRAPVCASAWFDRPRPRSGSLQRSQSAQGAGGTALARSRLGQAARRALVPTAGRVVTTARAAVPSGRTRRLQGARDASRNRLPRTRPTARRNRYPLLAIIAIRQAEHEM